MQPPALRGPGGAPWGARVGVGWALGLALLGAAPGWAVAATPRPGVSPPVRAATVSAILAEVRAGRAPLVLINVWATWCDPCREEMPELLRFYRAHRAAGLRLVLLSADDEDAGGAIGKLLGDAAAKAGLTEPLDATVYLKRDDDMKLIDGLDPRWGGALPATFLFDRDGLRVQSWLEPVTYEELERSVAPRLTKPRREDKRAARTEVPKPSSSPQPRRKP